MDAYSHARCYTRRAVITYTMTVAGTAILAACGQEPFATPTAAPTRIVSVPASPPSATPISPPNGGTASFVLQIDHDLLYPTALAVDRHGDLYVIDSGHHRVQKFDANGRFVTMWGTFGDDDGQFVFRLAGPIPVGIAVDEQDTVYVSDFYDRVQEFAPDGRFLRRWGASGSRAGQLYYPGGLAVDGHGAVYVVDTGNQRIQKFDRAGRFLLMWGRNGRNNGEFVYPSGIAVTAQGNVAVSDAATHRVQLFDSTGRFILTWSGSSSGNSQNAYPDGMAADTRGNIYTSDNDVDRITQFDSNGRVLARWGRTGVANGEFFIPGGIAVDDQGDIYVADVIGGRIEKFRQP